MSSSLENCSSQVPINFPQELSPTSPELASSPPSSASKPRPLPLILPEGVKPLTDEQKKVFEDVLSRRPESPDHMAHLSQQLSPLNKAKRKVKNLVGGKRMPS